MSRNLGVQQVDGHGVLLDRPDEGAVDVLLDGRRVWSFWAQRDTEPGAGRGERLASWPAPLRRYLDGRAHVVVRDPGDGSVHFEGEVVFSEADRRVSVVNPEGAELGIDKSGRLVPTFETRGREDIDALVRAVGFVLAAVRRAGVEPFVAYGTLLGAVRQQTVLGHDSDADIGYVSRHEAPVDVVRESFRIQREVVRVGYEVVRYSGAAFKVMVPEGDGHKRGLDVFGGFLDDGRLYLMGEVGADFQHDWVFPLGTAVLEGVEVPVPARPERLLEATYGPGWRVPDPVFQFETPVRTTRALNDWFRGLRPGFKNWQRRYALRKRELPQRRPSRSARRGKRAALSTDAALVLDLGAGRGADALWLARQGLRTVAYDFVTFPLDTLLEEVRGEDLPLTVRPLNLTELRSVLGEGARLAREPGRKVVVAEHLLDAVGPRGCENFARFCSMALRDGGSVHAHFFVGATPGVEWSVGALDADEVAAQWRAAGARDVTVVATLEHAPRHGGQDDDEDDDLDEDLDDDAGDVVDEEQGPDQRDGQGGAPRTGQVLRSVVLVGEW